MYYVYYYVLCFRTSWHQKNKNKHWTNFLKDWTVPSATTYSLLPSPSVRIDMECAKIVERDLPSVPSVKQLLQTPGTGFERCDWSSASQVQVWLSRIHPTRRRSQTLLWVPAKQVPSFCWLWLSGTSKRNSNHVRAQHEHWQP